MGLLQNAAAFHPAAPVMILSSTPMSHQITNSTPESPREAQSLICATIRVEAPCSHVFEEWRRFDDIPHFMRGSTEAHGLDGGRMVWRVCFDGAWAAWDAEVIHEHLDDGIFWDNKGAGRPCGNSGKVRFVPETVASTRIEVTCEFAPPPEARRVEESLDKLATRLQCALASFHSRVSPSGDEAAASSIDQRRSGWPARLPGEHAAVEAFFDLKCPFSFSPE